MWFLLFPDIPVHSIAVLSVTWSTFRHPVWLGNRYVESGMYSGRNAHGWTSILGCRRGESSCSICLNVPHIFSSCFVGTKRIFKRAMHEAVRPLWGRHIVGKVEWPFWGSYHRDKSVFWIHKLQSTCLHRIPAITCVKNRCFYYHRSPSTFLVSFLIFTGFLGFLV